MILPCPIWRADCGCSAMPQAWATQAVAKRARVVSALQGVWPAAEERVAETTRVGPDTFYRSKAIWVFGATGQGPRLGAYARGTHDLLPLASCVVVEPALARLVPWLDQWLGEQKVTPYDEQRKTGDLRYITGRATAQGEALLALLGPAKQPPAFARVLAEHARAAFAHLAGVVWICNDSPGNAIFVGHEPTLLSGAATVKETVSGLDFQLSVETFFQVHRRAAEVLRGRLLSHVGDEPTRVWDLYCGVGVNALCLAQRGHQVIGLESHAGAIAAARRNAQDNDLEARFAVADLGDPSTLPQDSGVEVVVLNPPRKGAGEPLLRALAASQARQVLYIACAPQPLALAVSTLQASGFSVTAAEPFDLFPHTEHVETLLVLNR